MIKKSKVAILVILAAVAIVFAAENTSQNSSTNPATNQSINQQKMGNSSDSGTSKSDTSNQAKISSAEAQKIAQKYIQEPSAKAGTPTLSKTGGKSVYTVPVIINGTNVGEIKIDALTGNNVGGAGGAPS